MLGFITAIISRLKVISAQHFHMELKTCLDKLDFHDFSHVLKHNISRTANQQALKSCSNNHVPNQAFYRKVKDKLGKCFLISSTKILLHQGVFFLHPHDFSAPNSIHLRIDISSIARLNLPHQNCTFHRSSDQNVCLVKRTGPGELFY